ncbi:hypothetical protein CH63R_13784 [Colletotrichum higginsianum IMI 349063]|uniref:Uncharacterized protein n=1 Tax=Colletotrichum higginsianum (strain IMI 349063) TaxID=759273 RepID=A0A1B7XRZ5_COLHI|nr:hypothetical protein CH63R_13784 [Colletotrichum higginsianum IMI 349063]OBR02558.1 hypothetical protein CH63R_13784 [Colletotrichum higginsianum IMI 349063]
MVNTTEPTPKQPAVKLKGACEQTVAFQSLRYHWNEDDIVKLHYAEASREKLRAQARREFDWAEFRRQRETNKLALFEEDESERGSLPKPGLLRESQMVMGSPGAFVPMAALATAWDTYQIPGAVSHDLDLLRNHSSLSTDFNLPGWTEKIVQGLHSGVQYGLDSSIQAADQQTTALYQPNSHALFSPLVSPFAGTPFDMTTSMGPAINSAISPDSFATFVDPMIESLSISTWTQLVSPSEDPYAKSRLFDNSESSNNVLSAQGSEQESECGLIKFDHRCVRCRMRKIKCTEDCCQPMSIRSLCVRASFENNQIFYKWDNTAYKHLIRWHGIERLVGDGLRYFDLFHFSGGASFSVFGETFTPSDSEQERVWEKRKDGWASQSTDAVRLQPGSHGDLSAYISSCRTSCVQESPKDTVLQQLWPQFTADRSLPMLAATFDLWTANRMLMKGWQTLRSTRVLNMCHMPCHNPGPTPRVLQNQLDQMLEEYIVTQERVLLNRFHEAIFKKKISSTLYVLLTIVLLLKVVEKHI